MLASAGVRNPREGFVRDSALGTPVARFDQTQSQREGVLARDFCFLEPHGGSFRCRARAGASARDCDMPSTPGLGVKLARGRRVRDEDVLQVRSQCQREG